ncbi:MAG: 30S ribosomal protein S7, partial [Bacteroidetes bacterium]|nr:30S ribosomal protein S7 [Bacteroidota bacterium]
MRKSKPKKKKLLPDPKYNDPLVTRFVNDLMLNGKKNVAYGIFYDALDIVEKKTKDSGSSPLEVWKKALENVTPSVEVKSRRVGGATFQVPMEIRPDRRISISNKALIDFAKKRSGKNMSERLAAEVVAAFNEEGGA